MSGRAAAGTMPSQGAKKPRTPRPGANKKIDFKVSDKKRKCW